MRDAPPEFKRHRYLTAGEDLQGMQRQFQGLESTRYAFRECKRLFYLCEEHCDTFLPEVTESLTAFEDNLIRAQDAVHRTALTLYGAGQPELARHYLTYYSSTEAANALRLVTALADSIEVRTKVQFGIRQPHPLTERPIRDP